MFVDEKSAGEKQPVQVGNLKLSTVMRIGAAMRPQGHTLLFIDGKSCALGAAYEGATGEQCGPTDYPTLINALPQLGSKYGNGILMSKIYGLNDNARWTREQIADWLESEGF